MEQQIFTLEQLQEEKKRLKYRREVAKQAFINSFGETSDQSKKFLVNKVALPAGALGLATFGIKQLASSPSQQGVTNGSNNKKYAWLSILPFLLPVFKQFFSYNNTFSNFIDKQVVPKLKEFSKR